MVEDAARLAEQRNAVKEYFPSPGEAGLLAESRGKAVRALRRSCGVSAVSNAAAFSSMRALRAPGSRLVKLRKGRWPVMRQNPHA
jgi:hypothetical protein